MNTQNSYLASKPHYEILDGLRGVAAVIVVIFHLFETHSGGNHLEQIINHGYLAVDFFSLIYTYTAWVCNNNATLVEGIPYMILTFVGSLALAYACLKFYDEPVRKWLTGRFLKGNKIGAHDISRK